MIDKKDKKLSILLLLGGSKVLLYRAKSHSSFFAYWNWQHCNLLRKKAQSDNTRQRWRAELSVRVWVNFPERKQSSKSAFNWSVPLNLYHRTKCSQIIKNILAKVKDREVLMFLQSCVRPCQQLQQSHPKSTEFQKSLTYLLHWKIIPWKKHRIQRQAFVSFLLQTVQQNMKKTPHQTKTSKPQTKTNQSTWYFY